MTAHHAPVFLPDPEILRHYSEPRSQVEVCGILSKLHPCTVRKHTMWGRRLGLLEEAGGKKPRLTYGPMMKLFRLTDRGRRYLGVADW